MYLWAKVDKDENSDLLVLYIKFLSTYSISIVPLLP